MKRTFLIPTLIACIPLHAYELKVSPDGPLKSIEAARDTVRTWRDGEGKWKSEAGESSLTEAATILPSPSPSNHVMVERRTHR